MSSSFRETLNGFVNLSDKAVLNTSGTITNLIKDYFLYSDEISCKVEVLSGGFINAKNGTEYRLRDQINNSPALFISCAGGETDLKTKYTGFLNLMSTIDVRQGGKLLLPENSTKGSMLIVSIIASFISIGSWMIYLVVLFLPDNNHNSQRKLVHIYVLCLCIFETWCLHFAIQTIFKVQYLNNYQDPIVYDTTLNAADAYRVVASVINVLCLINWLNIVYYMYHHSKKTIVKKIWLPRLLNTYRNESIIVVGCILIVLSGVFRAVSKWAVDSTEILILGCIFQCLDYVIFSPMVVCYIWNDFGYVLSPHLMNKKKCFTWKEKITVFYKIYHETVPALVFVITCFCFLFGSFLYFIIGSPGRWRHGIQRFVELVVTVSTWGLIGIFESRENSMNKETIIGKKIANADKLFIDPLIEYSGDGDVNDSWTRPEDSSSIFERTEVSQGKCAMKAFYKEFVSPKRVWISQIRQIKSKKLKKRKDCVTDQHPRHSTGSSREQQTNDSYALSDVATASTGDSGSKVVYHTVYDDDISSTETTLARNVIYQHHDEI